MLSNKQTLKIYDDAEVYQASAHEAGCTSCPLSQKGLCVTMFCKLPIGKHRHGLRFVPGIHQLGGTSY